MIWTSATFGESRKSSCVEWTARLAVSSIARLREILPERETLQGSLFARDPPSPRVSSRGGQRAAVMAQSEATPREKAARKEAARPVPRKGGEKASRAVHLRGVGERRMRQEAVSPRGTTSNSGERTPRKSFQDC